MASSFSRVGDSRLNSHKCSTAQVCLHRILRTIAKCPKSSADNLGGGNASLGIDLALRLGSAGSSDAELLAGESSLTIEKSSGNVQERAEEGSDVTNGDGAQRLEEGGLEQSKVSGFGDYEDRPERRNFDGFLGLLVEAARWVSGGFGDGDGSDSEGRSRRDAGRQERIRAGREEQGERSSQGPSGGGGRNLDGEPGVAPEPRRSERGRNRVMPCRYRDSVLEPYWKGMSPPRRRRRMSGPVSSKRRPR